MLIDFGIARWVSQQEKGVTAVGTMGYAPPELFSGRVQPASDVYSLGATMFHLLTGADPQDNPLLIFDFSKNPRPRQIAPSLSSEMEQILIMQLNTWSLQDRFRGRELHDKLAHHFSGTRSVNCRLLGPSWRQKQSRCKLSTWFLRRPNCRDDVACAHCSARQPRGSWLVLSYTPLHQQHKVGGGKIRVNASFILQRTAIFSGGRIPIQIFSPRSTFLDLIRKRRYREHARIWLEGRHFWWRTWAQSIVAVINDSVRLAPSACDVG
jgi:serine/threonine-protein kinase